MQPPRPDGGLPARPTDPPRERLPTDAVGPLLEALPDAVLVAGDDGRYQEANLAACQLLGLSRGDLLTRSVADLTPPGLDFQAAWTRFLAEGRMAGEWQMLTESGAVCDVEFSATAHVAPGRHLAVLRDVSERKRLEAQARTLVEDSLLARAEAEEANRLKDEFLALLSHELRSPLNAIIGWAHVLRTGPVPPETQARGLAAIQRNAEAQTRLVADLFDLSRVMAGKLALQVEPLSLTELVSGAVESIRPGADAKAVDLVTRLCEAPVEADRQRLFQGVMNLLGNALKFTPAGGRIEVTLETAEERVILTVRDSGIGIAPAFLPHVFERFRQADASMSREHGGLGLGLAIVWHIVFLHGGSVVAESEGLGRGAAFVVSLPLAAR